MTPLGAAVERGGIDEVAGGSKTGSGRLPNPAALISSMDQHKCRHRLIPSPVSVEFRRMLSPPAQGARARAGGVGSVESELKATQLRQDHGFRHSPAVGKRIPSARPETQATASTDLYRLSFHTPQTWPTHEQGRSRHCHKLT